MKNVIAGHSPSKTGVNALMPGNLSRSIKFIFDGRAGQARA
jgi:hypothetical protein